MEPRDLILREKMKELLKLVAWDASTFDARMTEMLFDPNLVRVGVRDGIIQVTFPAASRETSLSTLMHALIAGGLETEEAFQDRELHPDRLRNIKVFHEDNCPSLRITPRDYGPDALLAGLQKSIETLQQENEERVMWTHKISAMATPAEPEREKTLVIRYITKIAELSDPNAPIRVTFHSETPTGGAYFSFIAANDEFAERVGGHLLKAFPEAVSMAAKNDSYEIRIYGNPAALANQIFLYDPLCLSELGATTAMRSGRMH